MKGIKKLEINELKNELKKYLKDDRYKHSLCVMEVSEKLAEHYNINKQRVMKAALMHDMAKELPFDDLKKYIIDNKIYVSKMEMLVGVTLHGKVAADICKKKYKFDNEMCTAISNHTTGKVKMSMLEKIIFIADKIDETRTYEGIEELRNLAFKDINAAIIKNIDNSILINIKRGKPILEESIKTRNYILINEKK